MKCQNIKCEKEHDGSFGSGKFCSRSCANSRNWTEEDKVKKSLVMNGKGVLRPIRKFSTLKKLKVDKNKECLHCKQKTTNKLFCSLNCNRAYKKEQTKKKLIDLFKEGKLTYRSRIYNLLVERDGNKCSVCKIDKWQGKPIRLWVDHIDGNASNNTPSNFRLICPNCDCQSETFGAKNMGFGRRARGMTDYS